MTKLIKLFVKKSYGRDCYYPRCELSCLLREIYLIGRENSRNGFPVKGIEILRREGYDVQIE